MWSNKFVSSLVIFVLLATMLVVAIAAYNQYVNETTLGPAGMSCHEDANYTFAGYSSTGECMYYDMHQMPGLPIIVLESER